MVDSVNQFAFYYHGTHSWKEYIGQQYLKENMDIVISRNIREAVGTVQEIYKDHSARTASHVEDLRYDINRANENFEVIALNLEAVSESLDVLNSNVVSGFQALFVQVDELNSSLAHLSRQMDTLVEIARTPVQTWALNQYEIAQDLARRKLFPEALESLEYAIEGKDQHTGYKSDFRFHQLRAVVLMGIPGAPQSIDVIDLKGAERSFLLAARYARHDHATAAAQAYVGAGKAAYADGRFDDAHQHYKGALDLDEQCGEANFQIARLRAHAGDMAGLQQSLTKALDIHWSFAMRAAADILFVANRDLVERSIRDTADRILRAVAPTVDEADRRVKFFIDEQDPEFKIEDVAEFRRLASTIREVRDAIEAGTLKRAHEARLAIAHLPAQLTETASRYCEFLISRQATITARGVENKERDTGTDMRTAAVAINWAVIAVIFLVAMNSCTATSSQPTGPGSDALRMFVTLFFIFVWGCLGIGSHAVLTAIAEKIEQRTARALDNEREHAIAKNFVALQAKIQQYKSVPSIQYIK